MQKAPVSEEMRCGSDDPRQPLSCAFGPLAHPLELIAGPADQESIDTMQSRGQFRLVEVTVVVDPALDVRSEHPRQILQGVVGPMVQRPPSDCLPDRLERSRTSRWQEGSAIATAVPDRLSRTKGVAEKVKRLDRKVATPVRVLTIDELRLRRMKNQPTGPEADLQGIPEPARFFFGSAVADNVVRVSLERDGREAPLHPPVESIVQEQIGQDGADHSPNAKGNFCFDRVIALDRSRCVLDLRLKR